MIKLFCLNFIILISIVSCKDPSGTFTKGDLIPFKNESGKWGYKDASTNKELIKCDYVQAYPFIDNLALVQVKDDNEWHYYKYGLINNLGEIVVDIIYTEISPFQNGYSIVKRSNKYEIVDSVGVVITKHLYDEIKRAGNNHFIVNKGNKWGSINSSGEETIPIKYFEINYDSNLDGLIVYKRDRLVSYFSIEGKQLTPFKYNWISSFEGEQYLVAKDTTDMYSILDKSGCEKLSRRDIQFRTLKEDMISVYSNNKEGYMNMDGEIVLIHDYNSLITGGYSLAEGGYSISQGFQNGFVDIKDPKTNKWGFYNKEGKLDIPFMYDNVSSFRNGYSVVSKNKEYGIIDTKNRAIIDFKYQYLSYINDSLIIGKLNDKYGVIDINQNILLDYDYENIDVISDSLVRVRVPDASYNLAEGRMVYLYGFYTPKSSIVGDIIYTDSDINITEHNLLKVYIRDKMGFLDSSGKLVIPCVYDRNYTTFEWGALDIVKDGKRGFIDTEGREYWY